MTFCWMFLLLAFEIVELRATTNSTFHSCSPKETVSFDLDTMLGHQIVHDLHDANPASEEIQPLDQSTSRSEVVPRMSEKKNKKKKKGSDCSSEMKPKKKKSKKHKHKKMQKETDNAEARCKTSTSSWYNIFINQKWKVSKLLSGACTQQDFDMFYVAFEAMWSPMDVVGWWKEFLNIGTWNS